MPLRIIDAQQVFEFAFRPNEIFWRRQPYREAGFVDRDDFERRGLQRLLRLEDSDFGTLDEARIIVVCLEAHDWCRWDALQFGYPQGDRIRRDGQPRLRLEIVEAEPHLGTVESDVGAALDVGRAAVQVVDRLAVYGDVQHVKIVRALRMKLPGETRDVHALVVVQRQRFVIHDLHTHKRLLTLDEAR